ncbi:hypothetical protein [Amycolatopsis sp. MtRt-6]|uniref:hypothetical protein n=1 Tax=Amycolatopsis sp. MtRt-6 TaxID=2792782 RepID=UPI001A8E1A92|nr:hypothetical protein [Amycolatopsis sp. MtRt-6]
MNARTWTVCDERVIYRSPWVDLALSEVELPTGVTCENHLVRVPPSVAVAVTEADRVVMLWRHRFITDTWSWELLSELSYVQPMAGIANAEHFVLRGRGASYVGPPVDCHESQHIAWVPLAEAEELLERRRIVAAASVAGV